MSTLRHARSSSRISAIALALLATFVLALPAMATSGNSDASAACQDGGHLDWTDATGAPFGNTGACVSYAARGGMLFPVVVSPFSVSYRPFGGNGFQATVTGTGLQPSSAVDIVLTWGSVQLTLGDVADVDGEITFVASSVCTSLGSPLTAVGVAGTPAGGVHTEYPLPLPDATICPPPA